MTPLFIGLGAEPRPILNTPPLWSGSSNLGIMKSANLDLSFFIVPKA